MLSKTQKIWLWVSGAMFIVPEILWSPVVNFLYIFYRGGNTPVILRSNFLFDYRYESPLKIVIFIQLIGTLFFFISWLRSKNAIKAKKLFWVIMLVNFVLFLICLCIFYLTSIFNPSFL